jgi:oligopeptide transport system substrate-binding protein
MAAFGENPIGNGPYKFAKWQHNVEIDLVKSDAYKGGRQAKNGG